MKKLILAFTLVITLQYVNATTGPGRPDSSAASFSPKSIHCPKTGAVDTVIYEAIEVGAPTYNQGNHLGCYRIYEGASYKIIHMYGTQCARVTEILKDALEKSYRSLTDTEKAWIMRMAFDQILGVPTKTK